MGPHGGVHLGVSGTSRGGWLCLVGLLVTASYATAAAPVVQTITGTPLTIFISDDTSMEVVDANQSGSYVFWPQCPSSDSGVLVSVGDAIYGPDFASHCFTHATSDTPWTPVSISSVSGSGAPSDPFTVVVVVDAGATGLRLTETLTYVNGSTVLYPSLTFSNTGASAVNWNTFLTADVGALTTHGILEGLAPGAQNADRLGAPFPSCGADEPYRIIFPAANRYSSNAPEQVWAEISRGTLSNSIDPGCSGIFGLASEWTGLALGPGETLVVNGRGGISFIPALGSATTPIPALSRWGLVSLVSGLAAIGLIILRRP